MRLPHSGFPGDSRYLFPSNGPFLVVSCLSVSQLVHKWTFQDEHDLSK